MYWLPYNSTPLIIPHRTPTSLNLLCHRRTDAWFMQDGPKAVWNISYVSVAFFPSLKQNFIAYSSSKVSSRPVCIFEIHQQWQSGFSRVYSNYCCSCSFKPEIITIGQPSHKMDSNNRVNFQESTTILNACTKKSGNLLKAPRNISHRYPSKWKKQIWSSSGDIWMTYSGWRKWTLSYRPHRSSCRVYTKHLVHKKTHKCKCAET